MLKKSYSKTGTICRVTFKLDAAVQAERVVLCGDFNEWQLDANPMRKLKDGSFSTTISLESGEAYRFRYLVNDERWENDWDADAYWTNDFGSEDSVVKV